MKRRLSSSAAEIDQEEIRLRAAMLPERLDFIEKVRNQILEGGTPFKWAYDTHKLSRDGSGHEIRTDVVNLEIPCTSNDCGFRCHWVHMKCFPESMTGLLSPQPDEKMFLSPYPTSVQFWSRVQSCSLDSFDVFYATKNVGDFMERVEHNSVRLHSTCLPRIRRAIDYILTSVVDHVPTVADPYTRERVLPRCFNGIPRYFPHAFVAHSHRWGSSTQNPLPVFFHDAEFWKTYDAVRARFLQPPTVDAARYISFCMESMYAPAIRAISLGPVALLGKRLPNVVHVAGDYIGIPLASRLALAFPRVRSMQLVMYYIGTDNFAALILNVVKNYHLEKCLISFAPDLGQDDTPQQEFQLSVGREVCKFLERRRGLLEFVCADFSIRPGAAAPIGKQSAAWTAFFGNSIFERQTLGIVAMFLYDANFVRDTNQRLSEYPTMFEM